MRRVRKRARLWIICRRAQRRERRRDGRGVRETRETLDDELHEARRRALQTEDGLAVLAAIAERNAVHDGDPVAHMQQALGWSARLHFAYVDPALQPKKGINE